MIHLSQKWMDFNPIFVKEQILSEGRHQILVKIHMCVLTESLAIRISNVVDGFLHMYMYTHSIYCIL